MEGGRGTSLSDRVTLTRARITRRRRGFLRARVVLRARARMRDGRRRNFDNNGARAIISRLRIRIEIRESAFFSFSYFFLLHKARATPGTCVRRAL